MKIVFDTNVFDGDRYLRRPRMQQVLAGAAAGDFEVVVPEAVVGEMVKHFPTDLAEVVDDVNKALKKHYGRLNSFGLMGPEQMDVDVQGLASRYESDLRALLDGGGCSIAPVPDLTPALDWAIHRRKPFNQNGHGLPDASVWLTVLELARDDEVLLVCKDQGDFGDGSGGLHPDLLGDLNRLGLPDDRVRLVIGDVALVHDVVEPAADAVGRASRILADPVKSSEVTDAMEQRLLWAPVPRHDLHLGVDLDDDPQIGDVNLDTPALIDADELADGRLLCTIDVVADARLEMAIFRADIAELDDSAISVGAFDPDEHYLDGEAELELRLRLEVILDIELKSVTVELLEVRELTAEESVRRRLEKGAAAALIEHMTGPDSDVELSLDSYAPPEAIDSIIDQTDVVSWTIESVSLDEVLDKTGSALDVSLLARAKAEVAWSSSAPDPFDVEHFASIAEGVEHGGGFLQSEASDEPLAVRINATLNGMAWSDVDVYHAELDPMESARRYAEAQELHDPFPEPPEEDTE